MPKLNSQAKQARITAHKDKVLTRLAHRVIDVSKPEFSDLYADGIPAKKMTSLNGCIILERDLYPDGKLRGVVSVDVPDLAAMLPDLKTDTTDKTGWKKWLDKFAAEGVTNLFDGVPDPQPSEYDTSATEDLLALADVESMDPQVAKAAFKAIHAKAKAGNVA